MEEKCYCPVCQKEVVFKTEQVKETFTDRHTNITVIYDHIYPVCTICGEDLFVPKYNKINHATLEKAFLEAKKRLEK